MLTYTEARAFYDRFGGCRPICLTNYLKPDHWQVEHRSLALVANITSEVIVAVKPQLHTLEEKDMTE